MRKTKTPSSKVDEVISEAMRHLAKRRAQSLTPEQRREIAAKGGAAAWADTTPEERSAQARERWVKRRAKAAAQSKRRRHAD